MDDFNKSDHQVVFNQIKGSVKELNDTGDFCSITLLVGKNTSRSVNLIIKKELFKNFIDKIGIGDSVCVSFYISSKHKFGKWYTTAIIMGWNKL